MPCPKGIEPASRLLLGMRVLGAYDGIEAPREERSPAIAFDFDDLLAPRPVELAARIEEMHRRHHAFLENPISPVGFAVGRHQFLLHMRQP